MFWWIMGKSFCAQPFGRFDWPLLLHKMACTPLNRDPKLTSVPRPCTGLFRGIGAGSSIAPERFARHGAVCLDNINAAEYVPDAISVWLTPRVGDPD